MTVEKLFHMDMTVDDSKVARKCSIMYVRIIMQITLTRSIKKVGLKNLIIK